MTISISSLNQNTSSDQPIHKSDSSPKPPIKSTKKTQSQSQSHHISRLIASRRRRGVRNPEEEDGEDERAPQTNGHLESESSSSNDDSSISSLVNSDEDEDDEEDEDEDDFENDANDNENKIKIKNISISQNQVNTDKTRQKNSTGSDDDGDDTQFQVDPDDLEAGVPKQTASDSQPNENLQNHSEPKSTTNNSLVHDQPTTITAQKDTSNHPNAFSPLTCSTNPNNARRFKQPQTSVAVSSQPLNTAIIFNQASWVTGLSAALAATTTSSHNNGPSTDDQPVQTPRYIPYIEFENYSAYGNLIFDLNSGLGRTARVDCKPDGLEKAPLEALEEQFVRIKPSLEQPSDPGQPSSLPGKGSRRKSTLPVDDKPDLDQRPQNEQEDNPTPSRSKKLVNLNEKKKRKKKKKETPTHASSEAHGDEAQNEPSEQRFKIKIISPPPSSSKNHAPVKASSTSASSHHNSISNRPPSSLAGGLNGPPSAVSHAAHSEGNRSGSASEAHSLEPWAVPRSGRFWGHDDRQSYSQRRGGRGGFFPNRGGSGSVRGTLRKRAGFRVDWPSTPPSSRRSLASHGSAHRPETPAGQSDTGRSAGSGTGWITVPSKQKGFGAGFNQSRHSQLNSHQHQSEQADNGEWRHDGWEEIERETDRKHNINHRGRGGSGVNHQPRGGAGWRGGAPSAPTRRPNSNFPAGPSNRSSHAPSSLDTPIINGKSDDRGSNSPNDVSIMSAKGGDEPKVPPNSTAAIEGPQMIAQESSSKLVDGDDSNEEEEKKAESTPIPDAVPQPNESSTQSDRSAPSSETTNVISVKLPKTIKIGTIPVYPPVALQSVVAEKNEPSKLKVPSSLIDQSGGSIPGTDQSPSTPELSDTPQVSGSTSTLDDHPSPQPYAGLMPVISTESVSGSITLGSVGGAQVLREAMCTPKTLPPLHAAHHDSMMPHSRVEYPMSIVNSFGHSRTSSFNSHTFPPASFGPHPEFVEQQPHLRHPPSHHLPPNHNPPHLVSSTTYHSPASAPPPHTAMHTPANLYQPQLPAIPPLQYFDHNNHNMNYAHPSSIGPPPVNHVYGGYLPPPPPQLAPSRPHLPPLYHPQPTAFEPTPPPLPPPLSAPVTAATSNGMTLPGHFAPPKSTKVRITNPGSNVGDLLTTDHHQDNFHYHLPNHSNRISSDITARPTDPSQVKTTETGINYYEHNGVTYFGDCIPPIATTTNTTISSMISAPMNDSVANEGEELRGAGGGNADQNGMMINMAINEEFMGRNGDEFRPDDPYRFFNHPNHHHQYQSNGPLGHGFDHNGHRIDSSIPNYPYSIDYAGFNPNHYHHNHAGHVNNSHGITGSSGQVVLSQVIRPPSIPFG